MHNNGTKLRPNFTITTRFPIEALRFSAKSHRRSAAMEVESSSATRFRFRDHSRDIVDGELTEGANTSSDSSSYISSEEDDVESELDSMTGKGIKRLCSELLELKEASDEDFQKNIISNYASFVRIFEETRVLENEVLELKHYVTTHANLVKDLIVSVHLNILSEETANLDSEEPLCDEPPSTSILKGHAGDVLEVLDILLSERRIDEAILIFEMEAQEYISPEVRVSYNHEISERKTILIDQLTMVAENPRVPAAELQKALTGLFRLGVDHLATKLLLKYYHSRIERGMHDLLSSKKSQGANIREVAKFVFSMISQAARSFVVLYGETSPNASELEHWAFNETQTFALFFNKYVKSISEISDGLSTAAEAALFAVSYCSLLETQKIVLRPCLLKYILPCMEEVLQIHFDHFKKVICIFTAMDTWVMGRYLVSRILSEGSFPKVDGQHAEYCLLTNSGRKFVTLLQAIVEDVSSLVSIGMEGSILVRLMELFLDYSILLEKALTKEPSNVEKSGFRINTAESLEQQVSIIANVSTLVHFLSRIIRNVFKDKDYLKTEINRYMLTTENICSRARSHFCKQFIREIMFLEGQGLNEVSCIVAESDSEMLQDLTPSVSYQILFFELRKVEKLAEDNVVEVDWLKGLLTELVESIFDWVYAKNEITTITEEDLADHQHSKLMQFAVEMQLLVEIARCGGYLTNKMIKASQDLISHMESAYASAGVDISRNVINNEQSKVAALASLQKLKDLEETESFSDESNGDDNLEDYDQEAIDNYLTHSASDSNEEDVYTANENPINKDKLKEASNSKHDGNGQEGFIDLGEEEGPDEEIAGLVEEDSLDGEIKTVVPGDMQKEENENQILK